MPNQTEDAVFMTRADYRILLAEMASRIAPGIIERATENPVTVSVAVARKILAEAGLREP